jgi:hypothetical protein
MKIYHVFTNNIDEFTEDYRTALVFFEHFKKTRGCARLYFEIQTDDENHDFISEDCIKSFGDYPA